MSGTDQRMGIDIYEQEDVQVAACIALALLLRLRQIAEEKMAVHDHVLLDLERDCLKEIASKEEGYDFDEIENMYVRQLTDALIEERMPEQFERLGRPSPSNET